VGVLLLPRMGGCGKASPARSVAPSPTDHRSSCPCGSRGFLWGRSSIGRAPALQENAGSLSGTANPPQTLYFKALSAPRAPSPQTCRNRPKPGLAGVMTPGVEEAGWARCLRLRRLATLCPLHPAKRARTAAGGRVIRSGRIYRTGPGAAPGASWGLRALPWMVSALTLLAQRPNAPCTRPGTRSGATSRGRGTPRP
jgi:hypothetical protein